MLNSVLSTKYFSSRERQQSDDAERQEGDRLAGDQAAADERHAVHVGWLRVVLLALAPMRRPAPDGGEDAADAVPKRGGEFDKAAKARGVGTGQDDGVDYEVGRLGPGAAILPRLVCGAALQRDARELDHQADDDAEHHQLD